MWRGIIIDSFNQFEESSPYLFQGFYPVTLIEPEIVVRLRPAGTEAQLPVINCASIKKSLTTARSRAVKRHHQRGYGVIRA